MDIKILVAAHKPYWMPDDDVYLPIQVGAAGKESLGWQRDDEGDNISEKNPNYCELTALYWAWKNLDADYIGLCHYRRYFIHRSLWDRMKPRKDRIYHKKDYEKLLQKYDIILSTKGKVKLNDKVVTLYTQYICSHHKLVLEKTEKVLGQLFPEYKDLFSYTMAKNHTHVCNMFVMKVGLFHEYCTWLFSILFEVEKEMEDLGYADKLPREYGFLSERLFNVWIAGQNCRKCEIPIKNIEEIDIPWWRNIMYRITTGNK